VCDLRRYASPVQSALTSAAARDDNGRWRRVWHRTLGPWRRRPTLAAVVIYAVLSIVLVGQGALPGRTLSGSDSLLSSVPWQNSKPADVAGLGTNFELADASEQLQPLLQYARSVLPSVPLWNPYLMAGRPLLADGQSSVFSPFSVPSYVLPFWKSLAVVAMLKLFIAAFGAFMFARILGMRFGGALLCGVVFAFGTFYVIWLAWPLTSVFAWIPWTLAACELLVRRPGPLTIAALSAALGLQFLGGFPESSFHLVSVLVVFFCFRTLLHWRRGTRDRRGLVAPAVAFAASLAIGIGLAALVLAPFLQFIVNSSDLAQRAHTPAGYWPRKYLGALFLHDYWGRPTQVDLAAFMQVRGWYAGAATLMLAAGALILRRTAERIAVLVFAIVITFIVIGIPPVFQVVSALPGFDASHNERMLIYVLLSLALLAGWGLDDLCSLRPSRVSRRLVIGTSAVIFCIPIVWLVVAGTLDVHELWAGLKVAWGFVHPPVPAPGVDPTGSVAAPIVRDSALLIWLPLAGAGLGLIALRLRTARPLATEAFVGLIVLLLVIDLFRANMGFNPAIPERNAVPPTTGAIRYLQSQRPNRFIGVSTQLLSQPLPADLAMRYGLYDARGYDYPVESRFDSLWRKSVAPGLGAFTQPEEFAGATPASLRALDLLSVSDLLVGPEQAIATPLHGPGLHVVYRGKDAVVYKNDRALPRVFVVDHQDTISKPDDQLDAVTAARFDARGVAVTEKPLPGLPQATSAAPAQASARLVSYGAERIEISATASARSLVVLTDDYYPGWNATVDGHSVPIQRVDYLLRGIPVGPGRHTIVLRYQPGSWTLGWIISLLSLLVLCALVVVGVRRRRVRGEQRVLAA
jgi:Bacterial membrane protein YfhO